MAAIGLLMYGVGSVMGFVGSIMVLIKAFQESVVWGLASLFIPFVIFFFVANNWDETKTGFKVILAGCAVLFLGIILTFAGAGDMVEESSVLLE